jgi:two-component system, sensor histidine kinase LadS
MPLLRSRAVLVMCLLLAFVLGTPLAARAAAFEYRLPPGVGAVPVEQGLEVLVEQPGEALDADRVMQPALASRWQAWTRKRVNLPTGGQPVWLRFQVQRPAAPGDDWMLSVDWALLEEIDLHQVDTASGRVLSHQQGGVLRPAALRPRKDPAHVFPLELAPGQSATLLLRAQARAQVLAPLTLWEEKAWQSQRYDYGVFMGLLFGILGVMFFYNLSLYAFTRDPAYRTYTGYLLAIIGYELAVTGMGPLYVWETNAWLNRNGYPFFAASSFFAATLFFRRFLNLAQQRAHLDRLNQALLVFWALMMALTVLPLTPVVSLLLGVGSVAVGLAGVYVSLFLVWQRNVLARYMLVAWSTLIVATFATTLSVMGLIEAGPWVRNSQHIGFVLETVLLSIALAERIKRERLSKEAAERQSLELSRSVEREREEKLRAQEHALAVQRQANEQLEQRVHDRTAELERANRELARLSVTDGLTRVHNRRHFDETMKKEYDRSARSGTPLALMLVDIDHFKRINDSLGHQAGDECLKLVAAALSACASRSTDLVARYGGEEFAIVLPATDAEHAMDVAEQVRQAVEKIAFVHGGRRMPVSVSVGVVACVAEPGRAVAQFISQADEALYAAKGAGRNRAMLAA